MRMASTLTLWRAPWLVLFIAVLAVIGGCGTGRQVGPGTAASGDVAGQIAAIRTAQGLSPLVADVRLERAALTQAGYMARSGRMVHTTGIGRDFATRMKKDGVASPAAENIAAGRMDATRLLRIWMDSPPHRRNMLDPRMGRFGLASVMGGADGQTRYWALVLSR